MRERIYLLSIAGCFVFCILMFLPSCNCNCGLTAGWVVGKYHKESYTYMVSTYNNNVQTIQYVDEPERWVLVVDSGGVVERVNVCREQYDTTNEGTFLTIKR